LTVQINKLIFTAEPKLSAEELEKAKTKHNEECVKLAKEYGDHHLENFNNVDEYGRRAVLD